jgi:hypothetical protein
MSDEMKFETDFSELYAAKKWLQIYVGKMVTQLVNRTTIALRNHIVQDLFQSYSMIGPKNKGVINSRSGELKRNITHTPAITDDDIVSGGVNIGTVYNRMIFGKVGQVTHITPKSAGALAIPLPAALDSNGTSRGNPRDTAVFGETFLAKSKAGNMIIFGKLNYTRGAKAGQSHGDIVPLFVLKKSVDVPVQITLESLRDWVQPILGKGMADIRDGLMESTLV